MTRTLGAALALLGAIPTSSIAQDAPSEGVRDSVVKIYSSMRSPDLVKPWTKADPPARPPARGSSIEGKRDA